MFSNFLLKSFVLSPFFFFQSLDNYRFLLPFKPAFNQFRSRFTVSLTAEIMKARLAGSPAAAVSSEMPPLVPRNIQQEAPLQLFPNIHMAPRELCGKKNATSNSRSIPVSIQQKKKKSVLVFNPLPGSVDHG